MKKELINTLIEEVEKRANWYESADYGTLEKSVGETLYLIVDILKLLNGEDEEKISNQLIFEELKEKLSTK